MAPTLDAPAPRGSSRPRREAAHAAESCARRGAAAAFAGDARARAVADRALARGFDREVGPDLAVFFYMPFEHAEDAADQARAVALFEAHAAAHGDGRRHLRYARLHAALIARFGRFPHRNAALHRGSTPAEVAYLAGGGFRG